MLAPQRNLSRDFLTTYKAAFHMKRIKKAAARGQSYDFGIYSYNASVVIG
jgi:hypothetical protein